VHKPVRYVIKLVYNFILLVVVSYKVAKFTIVIVILTFILITFTKVITKLFFRFTLIDYIKIY
jgi:hypothetical protein